MAVLIRPRRWGQTKPGPGATIDWGHPLTVGLIACVPATEGGGVLMDLVSRRQLVAVPGTGTTGWGYATGGTRLQTTGTGYVRLGTEGTDLTLPTSSASIAWRKWRSSGANAQSAAFGVLSTTDSVRFGAHAPWSDGSVYCDFGGATGSNRLTVSSLAFADDSWLMTAGRRGIALAQNGRVVGSQATAVTRSTSTSAFGLGNGHAHPTGHPGETEVRYGYFYLWARELVASEAAWLHAEPYAFLVPASPRVAYFALDAGIPAVTGTAALTLPALTAAGTGELTFTGTAALTLPALTAAGTGVVEVTGTAALTLPALTAAGTGELTFTGTAALTLPALTAAGTGTFTGSQPGTITATFAPTGTITATFAPTGTTTGVQGP